MAMILDASNRSAEDIAKQFQEYLRKYENDDKLVILKAVDKPGSKLGDNYTSVLVKTELVGTRGDGSPYNETFMTKMLTHARPIAGFLNLFDLFRIESHMYKNILPILGSFGPECVFADTERIIMEDLGVKGYANCDRRKFLDLNHTIFALKKVAKFHASAYEVKIKKPQMFNQMIGSLDEIIYKDAEPTSQMGVCTEMCMQTIVDLLKIIKPWTSELQDVLDHVTGYTGKSYTAMHRLFNAPKRKYDTICHGDLWNNNLLFLHDDKGEILDLKMVDYQISRYTSPSMDILYLIYTSTRSSVIEKDYENLIKSYHDELMKELRQRGIDEKILAELGMDWLQAELKTYAFYGVLMGCTLANPMLANEAEVEQFEKINMADMTEFASGITQIAQNQEKIDRVRYVATHYYKRYILGITNGTR